MATIRGTNIVFGTGAIVWAGAIASSSKKAYQRDATLTRDSQKVEVMDDGGNVVSQVFHAHKRTLNITVIPHGDIDTSDLAASMTAWGGLSAGATASITSTVATEMDDNYNIISSSVSLTQAGVAVMDLVLESFDLGEITATQSA